MVLWQGREGVLAARRPPGVCPPQRPRACFGSVESLGSGREHTVTFGAAGIAYAAWVGPARSAGGARTGAVKLARALRGRRFSKPRRISRNGTNVRWPQLAAVELGGLLLAWRGGDNESLGPVETALVRPGGAISARQKMGSGAYPSFSTTLRLLCQPGSEAILVWNQLTGDSSDEASELVAAVRRPGGAFGPPEILTSPDGFALPARHSERHWRCRPAGRTAR